MSFNRVVPSRRYPLLCPLAACLALALAAPLPAFAGGLPVTNCNDSGSGSLRAAIAAAVSGDVIDLSGLSCSSIVLTSGALQIGTTGDFTVRGAKASSLTLSGNGQSRVFEHAGTGFLRLAHLTIAQGRATDQGGCIRTQDALTLDDVIVRDCAAGSDTAEEARGGAIASGGDVTATGSVIADNQVDGTGRVFGGGIASSGTVRATQSEIRGNHAHSHNSVPANQFSNIPQGGGVHADLGIELRDSRVTGNTVLSDSYEAFGGGFSAGVRAQGASPATLLLIDSTVSGNVNQSNCDVCAPQGGGGIVAGGNATITRSTIADNRVSSTNHYGGGGGFRFFGPDTQVELVDSVVAGNQADSAGGGMIGPEGGVLHVERSRIEDNEAGNQAGLDEAGGGILTFGGSVELISSSVTGNVSGADGGGINLLFHEYAPNPTRIVNSTISGNDAREGGGVFASGGDLVIDNSTIAFNAATRRGAGVSADEYTYTIALHSSIVANNQTAGAANNLWTFPKVVTGSNNLIPNAPGLPTELPADTLTADPQLQPLAANGAATSSHALAANSPAIDAGSNPGALTHDQRGLAFVRSYGAAPDIGAYEAQPLPDVLFRDGFQ